MVPETDLNMILAIIEAPVVSYFGQCVSLPINIGMLISRGNLVEAPLADDWLPFQEALLTDLLCKHALKS